MNFGKAGVIAEHDLPEVALAAEMEFVSSERDFIERLKAGESTAFDELITKFSGDVYAILYRLTENPEDARDLTQETFLRVVQSIGNFRGDASLKTWLIRIAINQARNRRRWWLARKLNLTFSLDAGKKDDETFSLAETLQDESQISPEAAVLQSEQSSQLHKALRELAPNFREAVVLRDIEGLSYEEIAAALETNVGTIKSRIARGRDELRRKLKRSL